jgi:hypothetical protein
LILSFTKAEIFTVAFALLSLSAQPQVSLEGFLILIEACG